MSLVAHSLLSERRELSNVKCVYTEQDYLCAKFIRDVQLVLCLYLNNYYSNYNNNHALYIIHTAAPLVVCFSNQ